MGAVLYRIPSLRCAMVSNDVEGQTIVGKERDRAVAVLILDRNQDHPVTPVRNPGGALLGMVRKARRGELRLTGSVIGILQRGGAP